MQLPSRRKSNSPGATSSLFRETAPTVEEVSPEAAYSPVETAGVKTIWPPTGFTGRLIGFKAGPEIMSQRWIPRRCPTCGCHGGYDLGQQKLGRGRGSTVQFSFTCRCGSVLYEQDAVVLEPREGATAPPRCPRCRHTVSPRTDELLWRWLDPWSARCLKCNYEFIDGGICKCPYCLKQPVFGFAAQHLPKPTATSSSKSSPHSSVVSSATRHGNGRRR